MGTLYYAYNAESKKAVELGKWAMYELEPFRDEALPNIKSRADFIASMDAGEYKYYSKAGMDARAFYDRMLDYFDEIGWPIEVVSENDRIDACDIFLAFSRYDDADDPETNVGTRLCTHLDGWCEHI